MIDHMTRAIALAKQAAEQGEVPVGAVVVESSSGRIIAESHNLVEATGDPTKHAEMLAINQACQQQPNGQRLRGCDLYITLEPCPMCAGAISHAKIDRVYFGAYDPKGGGVAHGPRIFDSSSCHHAPEVYGGIKEAQCAVMLKEFFAEKR